MLRILFVVVTCTVAGAQTPLITNDTLDDWIKVGDASFSFEEGVLTGEAEDLPRNSFLVSPGEHADFELQTDVFVENGNSGIQIRSRIAGRAVKGYQIEIDPSKRAWSGGLYDEGRRGWLAPLTGNDEARAAFKSGEWNSYRILCEGPRIRTWINGVPCVDHIDTMDLTGHIAFQVHGGKQMRIHWRNPRIRALGEHTWKPIWNGANLDGWHTQGSGEWTVEDSVLIGAHSADIRTHGHLITDDRFDDFTLRVSFKATKGNSGLYFRVDKGEPYGVLGFQAEIDASRKSGGLYETAGRAWVYPKDDDEFKNRYHDGKWNTMTVHTNGGRIVVHLNGHLTAELKDDPGRREGHVALQLHGGQDMQVEFRSIEMLEHRDP